jgi:signal transduction histidine kinase/CheY-like chemotaxis protein/HAMP domain-containing protein
MLTATEDEFLSLLPEDLNYLLNTQRLKTNNIDFIFEKRINSTKPFSRFVFNENVYLPAKDCNLDDFLKYNPYALVFHAVRDSQEFKNGDPREYYYGRILSTKVLDEMAQKINASIAIVWEGTPTDVSNASINQKYLYFLTQANEYLKSKNNFDIYTGGTEADDIIATISKPTVVRDQQSDISFVIFTSIGEAAELKSTLRDMLGIIGFVGIALSLIFTFLFTDKLRKQITELSKATKETYGGNFKNKIKVKSKDELGNLAEALNKMLDELEKKEKAKNEYSDFITLINQNPTLREISDAALKKIIHSGGFLFGALYSVQEGELNIISSYGLNTADFKKNNGFAFYDRVIDNKETIELIDADNLPLISAGILNIQVKYLLILPIIYNNKTISVIELGSVSKPSEEVKEYLAKIKEQLAIGLTNANALVQLENFISELKNLNEDYQKQNLQIKKQNDTLLQLHNELKEQATELEVQKQKAEESTKVKSQFLASMSHELRTPMNSILGLTELILEKAEMDKKNKERLEVVLNSGKRLMILINDILDLSKIEAGKMEVRYEDVLLDELVEEVVNSITPLAHKKGIDFNIVRNTNTHIIVNTDRGKIVQVLINLLGNAVKFTDIGGVTLQVSSSNDILTFGVTDSGIGISDEDQKLIFEEFRQVDGSTTRKYGGTGLGLAICSKIADLLGGNISVKSKIGEGSTFSFIIPLKFVEKKPSAVPQKINVETLIKNRKNPILVIDDDEEVRYTIGQYLISKGYEVIFAKDGDEGIKMALEHQPFAITLDVMLPDKDGWSVLRDLKENPGTKDIPVILVSIIGEKNIGYGLGAFEYFVKPISSDKLLSAFSKLENLANKRIQKIVIVDDDELEFEKFKREFANDDIRIEYIKDSEYAFSKIAEVQPDLIILDLMMPKIDGVTLSYKLKSNVKTRHIPILISTAKDLSADERKSLSNIVENIAVKSKGHPLDVLKIVRDRIRMQEINVPMTESPSNGNEKNPVQQLTSRQEKSSTERKDFPGEESKNKNVKSEPEQLPDDGLCEVLIVDDDPDTLFTLGEIVEACKCKTLLAKNGKECLEVLEHATPDLILLDIMMPVMDGFQTIKQIRGNNKFADIPVFAVTAKAMKDDREVILKHGFNDYIPKPVNPTIMSFKIQQFLSQLKTE